MNKHDSRYSAYALVSEMLEAPAIVRRFPVDLAHDYAPESDRLFLTGEGSSRIFPAKHARYQLLLRGDRRVLALEGGAQAAEYNLSGTHVYAASNSGRTAEVVRFLSALSQGAHSQPLRTTAVVAHGGGPIGTLCDNEFVLTCGPEEAVAATKSVVEQALFYHTAIVGDNGDLAALSAALEQALTEPVPKEIITATRRGGRIYFAGRNDGVAEELALKTNEITRRSSAFLEGTFAVHGVEEVMTADDIVVVVDPFPEEEKKFQSVLADGVGLAVVAIADRQTRFPTLRVPSFPGWNAYVQLLSGWNLLVEIGLDAGVNLDKPTRARKVGNEFNP